MDRRVSLAVIALHAAHAAFTHGLSSKWCYLTWTIRNMAHYYNCWKQLSDQNLSWHSLVNHILVVASCIAEPEHHEGTFVQWNSNSWMGSVVSQVEALSPGPTPWSAVVRQRLPQGDCCLYGLFMLHSSNFIFGFNVLINSII